MFQWWIYHAFCFTRVKGFEIFFAAVTQLDPELFFAFIVKIMLGFAVTVFTIGAKNPLDRPWVPAETADQ